MPTKPPSPWTEAQWRAITTTGTGVLVSAAAGSGKTAVLAERCAYLVCDAKNPCDIDQLLVVTFTEAAAAEMKSRIQRALRQRINQSPTNQRLARQLALIDRAEVSTLHGFCAKLIRQHFHVLGLDPAFTILDGDEAALLRTEIARALFADRYENDTTGHFQSFIDSYGDGNDEPLIRRVIQTHELLCSLISPETWLTRAQERITRAAALPLLESDLGRELIASITRRLTDTRHRCANVIKTLSRQSAFAKYADQLKDLATILDHWETTLRDHGLDALIEIAPDLQFPRLPPLPNSTPGKEAAKAALDSVREEIKSGPLREMLRFTTAQWLSGLRSTQGATEVFLTLVQEFSTRYRAAKDSVRAADFADLERHALTALTEQKGDITHLSPSPVAHLLHRRFRHVLVDEYQDINEVQDAILSLVSTECLTHEPSNLFAVGDVKQSIYRFRLAEPHRFLQRQTRFRSESNAGVVIDLQSNFRSRAPLLDALNATFQRLMTQDAADIHYDKSQHLYPGLTYPTNSDPQQFKGAPIELHLMPSDPAASSDDSQTPDADPDDQDLDRSEREALLIARRILSLTGQDGTSASHVIDRSRDGTFHPRPLRLGDIVILLRSMRYKSDQFANVLRRSGIPVHCESATGYFDSMEVSDILSLLKVLDNRRQDIPLAAFLRSPLAMLPEPQDSLARIRLAYPNPAIPFHEAVLRYPNDHDDDLAAHLRDLVARLNRWRQMAQRRPLADLLWDIYDSTGYLAFCSGLSSGQQRLANLIDLHERARQFGSFHRQGLSRFLAFLDSLQSESDLGQPPVLSSAENVVRIMSIHRAKGLEFPVVILPDLAKKINLSDASGFILTDRQSFLGLSAIDEQRRIRYPSLASTLVQSRLRQQSLAEELRVLYVAMTRAKEHLILIGTPRASPDSALETWASRWSGHSGPFPTDTILGASSMLDWLGPVAVSSPASYAINLHTPEEISTWTAPESLRPAESDRLQRLARLDPITPIPPHDPIADQVIARLKTPYAYTPFTRIPAAQSVTTLAKESQPVFPSHSLADEPTEFPPTLPIPRSRLSEIKPSASDIGSATHLLLERLDFTRPCDEPDLRLQLQDLLDRRLISPAAAAAIDLAAICWFTTTRLADLIREHLPSVHRELPIYFPIELNEQLPSPAPFAPLDRTMLRSRLDVLIPTCNGPILIDYKTDRVTALTLPARVEFYQRQMCLYRDAIQSILGAPPVAMHLVFLSLREIRTLR